MDEEQTTVRLDDVTDLYPQGEEDPGAGRGERRAGSPGEADRERSAFIDLDDITNLVLDEDLDGGHYTVRTQRVARGLPEDQRGKLRRSLLELLLPGPLVVFALVVIASGALVFFTAAHSKKAIAANASADPDALTAGPASGGGAGGPEGRGASVKELVARIAGGDYEQPEDVATGRFLEEFAGKAYHLDDVDLGEMRVKYRGYHWVVISAPYVPAAEPEGTAQLRFVYDRGRWKIEQLAVLVGAASRAPSSRAPSIAVDPSKNAPRERLRIGLMSDVKKAFEDGSNSGLVDLQTSEEWGLFEELRSAMFSGEHGGIPALSFVGGERGGVREYTVSFDGKTPLGIIKLKEIGGRWHIVGVESLDAGSRANARKRRALEAILSEFRKRTER